MGGWDPYSLPIFTWVVGTHIASPYLISVLSVHPCINPIIHSPIYSYPPTYPFIHVYICLSVIQPFNYPGSHPFSTHLFFFPLARIMTDTLGHKKLYSQITIPIHPCTSREAQFTQVPRVTGKPWTGILTRGRPHINSAVSSARACPAGPAGSGQQRFPEGMAIKGGTSHRMEAWFCMHTLSWHAKDCEVEVGWLLPQ